MKCTGKKCIAALVGLIVMVAMLLTGTFAWQDYTQHATNPFTGNVRPNVTLNNHFAPPKNWNPTDAPVPNLVSVTNTKKSEVPLLVRVRFEEYLQGYTLNLDHYLMDGDRPVLLATHASGLDIGEYFEFNTFDEAQTYITSRNLDYTIFQLDEDNDKATPDKYFLRTQNNELKNGIYGKAILDPAVAGIGEPIKDMLFGGVERIDYNQILDDYSLPRYKHHNWNGAPISNIAPYDGSTGGKFISDYISWGLGADTIMLKDWADAGMKEGNQWVLADDGWSYWVTMLPIGETTSDLLESVKLLKMPGDALAYEIHIDMQAITQEELSAWTDMPQEISTLLSSLETPVVAP